MGPKSGGIGFRVDRVLGVEFGVQQGSAVQEVGLGFKEP